MCDVTRRAYKVTRSERRMNVVSHSCLGRLSNLRLHFESMQQNVQPKKNIRRKRIIARQLPTLRWINFNTTGELRILWRKNKKKIRVSINVYLYRKSNFGSAITRTVSIAKSCFFLRSIVVHVHMCPFNWYVKMKHEKFENDQNETFLIAAWQNVFMLTMVRSKDKWFRNAKNYSNFRNRPGRLFYVLTCE